VEKKNLISPQTLTLFCLTFLATGFDFDMVISLCLKQRNSIPNRRFIQRKVALFALKENA
jgi:hypothetical protein